MRIVADIFAAKKTEGDDAQAALLREQAKEIETAVAVMDKWGGCWS